MNNIVKDIFKAIFSDKWISIEYNNKSSEITKYWIGIKKIIISNRIFLLVDGLHVVKGTITELKIDLSKISYSCLVDGSYYQTPLELKEDIENNRLRYQQLFSDVANLKILNYLSDCNRLDSVPYAGEYALISKIDDDKIKNGDYSLDQQQYLDVIRAFQIDCKDNNKTTIVQLALNILSVYTKKGLYVLAYRDLHFDVKNKCFRASNEIHVCRQYNVNNSYEMSIRYFLDESDAYLLNDVEDNLSLIEDKIMDCNNDNYKVDDIPYIIALTRDIPVCLDEEFRFIEQSFEDKSASLPLQAYFGQLIKQPRRNKNFPVVLLDKKVNLDQMEAINHSVKYPITYVQGPPGTGKTNTIINTILTCFFNNKTILFSSYNNHPIDSVFEKLKTITWQDKKIIFPILRIGNNEKMLESLKQLKQLFNLSMQINFTDFNLDKHKEQLKTNSVKLANLLSSYEELLDLKERKETIERLLESSNDFNFQLQLQASQLNDVNKKINQIGQIKDEDVLKLVVDDDLFKQYLYYSSLAFINKLKDETYDDLKEILMIENQQQQVISFNKYLSNNENMAKLLKVFPVVAATCLSCHKIGAPNVYFDITIMDEASQCNNAVSLMPILRSRNLLLVGDPQQLNPVILLDSKNNEILKQKYNISDEYDYIKNSIYKTFLAADCISKEILLSNHYRCDKKIIDFCNKKYYNNKLVIKTNDNNEKPLVYVDIKNNESVIKNTAVKEVDYIVDYLKNNPNKSIGIITPFVNQKKLLEEAFKKENLNNVTCGTVHAFQGDEKDEVIFSLALTDKTSAKTYNWLKDNKELINVGMSRAKNKLTILASEKEINRLHSYFNNERDDIFELINYVKSNGAIEITPILNKSRALGIKPYSSEIEETFLMNLNHCLDNILKQEKGCSVKKEVAIAAIFKDNKPYNDLFYSGRFDFVVFEKEMDKEIPILAIELDGKEHYSDEAVKRRDEKKNLICKQHGFDLIRIDNSYCRRYNYIKEILINYFSH